MKRNAKGQFIKKETAESLRARYIAAGEEIRANEVTIEARKNEIAQLEKEREELREKVRALGFDFFEASAEPEEDMTDPNNWRVGDILEQHTYSFKNTYTPITRIENGRWFTKDNDGPGDSHGNYESMKKQFKFHSRPSK